jgi:hypothetical protein
VGSNKGFALVAPYACGCGGAGSVRTRCGVDAPCVCVWLPCSRHVLRGDVTEVEQGHERVRTWRDAAEDRHGTSIMWNAHGTSPSMNMGKLYEKARMVAPTMLMPRHMQMVRTSPSNSTMRLTSIINADVSSADEGEGGGIRISVNMPHWKRRR